MVPSTFLTGRPLATKWLLGMTSNRHILSSLSILGLGFVMFLLLEVVIFLGRLNLSSMGQRLTKTDVWVCCDLRYLKSNDVIKVFDVIAF